ncbi:MAG TPA: LuxR C-terminal-related transcriptional regulator [Streptosporangiaceae bacterium]|nr:LuxR C-terminal-related transcriptional regulator [Streptosporangiaceae bacterium]
MANRPGSEGSGRAPSGSEPGLIRRHDLVAALDRAAQKRVTIVSAPAGTGKTSLLRAWADRPGQDCRVAFVTVRPGQHDMPLFWLTVLGAVRAAAGSGEDDAQLPAVAPGSSGDAMVDRVLSELGESGARFVLVIDDLHELSSPDAAAQVTALLTRLPPDVRAVVATRRDLPLRLHKLRLAGDLAEIRAAQLRFTEQETRQLLAAAGIALPEHTTAMLHQRTEGWAAGLRLAVLSLAGHSDPERFVAEFSGSDRTVAEYLMAEMLERQPPEVLRLLLRTSVLDRVNGELAELLTGATGSERMLLDLEDANAFVVSVDPGRTWFRYHRMFGDLLRLELRRTMPADVAGLHQLAAHWLAARGQAADAIGHLQAAGAWDDAARMLTDHALSLTLDGQAGTVTALLRSFPAQTGADSPDLTLVRAIADQYQLRLDQTDAHLREVRAYAATTPPARQHRLQMAIASVDLLSARLRGDFDSIFEQATALLCLGDGQASADATLGSDLKVIALLNLGVTEAWSLRMADSERHLTEGAALAGRIGRPYLEVACLAHLGFAATSHSFAVARQRCEEAITVAARHGWDADAVTAPALAALANALIWTGQFDHAEHWLDRATRATQDDGEPGIRLLVCLTSAILQAARGRGHRALEEFAAARRTQALMIGEHGLTTRVNAWTIATQARLGMTGQARAALAAIDGSRASAGEIRNAAAAILLAEHDPVAARRELRLVLDGDAPVLSYLTRVEAHLLDAFACRDLGDERATRDAAERALNLAEPDRLVLPFAMTGAWQLLEAGPRPGTSHKALVTDILDAIRGPGQGGLNQPVEKLSRSELRVLRYLPTNLTRREIADELSVSLNTVDTHIRRIYAKLGAADRTAAVERGRELRLLSVGRT